MTKEISKSVDHGWHPRSWFAIAGTPGLIFAGYVRHNMCSATCSAFALAFSHWDSKYHMISQVRKVIGISPVFDFVNSCKILRVSWVTGIFFYPSCLVTFELMLLGWTGGRPEDGFELGPVTIKTSENLLSSNAWLLPAISRKEPEGWQGPRSTNILGQEKKTLIKDIWGVLLAVLPNLPNDITLEHSSLCCSDPSYKIISLLLQTYNFAAVINHNENIR